MKIRNTLKTITRHLKSKYQGFYIRKNKEAMTRINSAISVAKLTDEHLLAEHREIKRLPYCLQKAIKSGSINHIPKKFTLGTGHVLFFLDKMLFTMIRYILIRDECKRRGLNVTDFLENWVTNDIPDNCKQNYTSTEEERQLLIERITERINNSKKPYWHYYGMPISRGQAIELLWK